MISIRMKFRASSIPKKEGVIYYQIISNRKVKLISTRFKIYTDEWDSQLHAIKWESKDAKRLQYLISIRGVIKKEMKSMEDIASLIKFESGDVLLKIAECYHNDSMNGYLFPFMRLRIEELLKTKQEKTASTYSTALRSFSMFRENMDIKIEQIDFHLMNQYQTWLKERKVRLNTISFYMRILRAVYNRAVYSGLTLQSHPFKNVYTGVEKTVKRYVEIGVITKLKNMKFSKSVHLEFARDMFLFSFYTMGMAYVDMASLKRNDIVNGYIIYYRHKTGQRLCIKMVGCILDIINKYSSQTTENQLLPILSTNLKYNSALRTQNYRLQIISEKIGLIKPITSYVPRHSWANFAQYNGIAVNVISECMGHNNESTTRIYLASLDQPTIDKANEILLSKM